MHMTFPRLTFFAALLLLPWALGGCSSRDELRGSLVVNNRLPAFFGEVLDLGLELSSAQGLGRLEATWMLAEGRSTRTELDLRGSRDTSLRLLCPVPLDRRIGCVVLLVRVHSVGRGSLEFTQALPVFHPPVAVREAHYGHDSARDYFEGLAVRAAAASGPEAFSAFAWVESPRGMAPWQDDAAEMPSPKVSP